MIEIDNFQLFPRNENYLCLKDIKDIYIEKYSKRGLFHPFFNVSSLYYLGKLIVLVVPMTTGHLWF